MVGVAVQEGSFCVLDYYGLCGVLPQWCQHDCTCFCYSLGYTLVLYAGFIEYQSLQIIPPYTYFKFVAVPIPLLILFIICQRYQPYLDLHTTEINPRNHHNNFLLLHFNLRICAFAIIVISFIRLYYEYRYG